MATNGVSLRFGVMRAHTGRMVITCVGCGTGEAVAVGTAVGTAVALGVGVGVLDAVGDAVTDGVRVGDKVGWVVIVGVGDEVAVANTTGQALHTKKLRKQAALVKIRSEATPPPRSHFWLWSRERGVASPAIS